MKNILPVLLSEPVSEDWTTIFLHTTGNSGDFESSGQLWFAAKPVVFLVKCHPIAFFIWHVYCFLEILQMAR
ncbi:MAG: hypothetical protein IPK95_07035 [Cellvibrionales bacterium]|nr:hypothetical protein [Cellvibrionales bacterium]